MKNNKRGRPSKKHEYSRSPYVQNKARTRIKEARKRAGITETELANLIHLHPDSYHDVESRSLKAPITEEIAKEISKVLKERTGTDYNPAYLTGVSKSMTIQDAQSDRERLNAKIQAIKDRETSALCHFGVLHDAAAADGITLHSCIAPEITSPDDLAYLRGITWDQQIPDRVFLLKKDGETMKELSGEEYMQLTKKLSDYAKNLIDDALKQEQTAKPEEIIE